MAGASWPQARVGDISQDVQPTCLLCGVPIADSLHVSWNCPCVNAFDDEAISKNNHLADLANQEASIYTCYWLAGIMPKTLATLPEEMSGFVDKFFCSYYLSAPPEGAWPSGDYFGDAVCVCAQFVPTLRRVGLGFVCMQGSACQFGLKSYLRGDIQTIHRGEAAVALVLLGHLQNGSVVNYYGDNETCEDTFNKGCEHCRTTLNADIFRTYFVQLIQRVSLFPRIGCPATCWRTQSAGGRRARIPSQFQVEWNTGTWSVTVTLIFGPQMRVSFLMSSRIWQI